MVDYAVIVPTLNEKDNVILTVERLERVLSGMNWEVVFVDDDSTDGTWQELLKLAAKKPHVRLIRRVNRRGLSSACVEGMLATAAPYLAVMDADLQHDAAILPQMFAALVNDEATVAVGSRYCDDGGVGEWDKTRAKMSQMATVLASKLLLTPCSDPMSGFFALKRSLIDEIAPDISLSGFKILFDILTTKDIPLKVKEIPYTFCTRIHGTTKLSVSTLIDFAWLLLKKISFRLPITNFFMFCLVGLTGVAVHFCVLYTMYKLFQYPFFLSQCTATFFAMTSNYFINNRLTFFSNQLRGKAFIKGYFLFCLACTFGAIVNIAISELLFGLSLSWFFAAGAGIVAGSVVNYIISKTMVWKGL